MDTPSIDIGVGRIGVLRLVIGLCYILMMNVTVWWIYIQKKKGEQVTTLLFVFVSLSISSFLHIMHSILTYTRVTMWQSMRSFSPFSLTSCGSLLYPIVPLVYSFSLYLCGSVRLIHSSQRCYTHWLMRSNTLY